MLTQRRSTILKWQLALVSASMFSLYLYYNDNGQPALTSHFSARHLLQSAIEDEVSSTRPNISDLVEEKDNCGYVPSDSSLFPPNTFSDDALGKGALVLYIIGVLYMFYALALICDQFFVPSLEVIIERFDISQDVAGATLMAAGGSAPELFTSVIGVFIAQSDVGTGTIVGSAVFNVLFVIAACAFASVKALSLTAWPLIRDTTFYSIALALLVGFFSDNKVWWWEALILFLWYIVYVVFMKFNKAAETKFHSIFPSLKEEETADADDNNFRAWGRFDPNRTPLFVWMQGQVKASSKVDDIEQKRPPTKGIHGLKLNLEKKDNEELDGEEGEKGAEEGENNAMMDVQNEEDYKDIVCSGPQGTVYSKLIWYISMPLMIPMWITTPDPNNPTRKKFFAMTFIVSILWIMVFSYLMVWWTTVIGNYAGIPDSVMGLTFLAAGTSVPDLITSVIVAKQGHGDMAVSSSIGSNIFDVCVGLPVPWLLYTIFNEPYKTIDAAGMGCNVGMLFLMLILVFCSIMAFKWKMTKVMGGIMLVLYAIFVTISLMFSFCIFSCDFM
jgi:K+-dependent Na+/Ca+ exchanger-like protein